MNKKAMESEEGGWEGGMDYIGFYCSYISWS